MYNRYIPGSNGVYQRQIVQNPNLEQEKCEISPPAPHLESTPSISSNGWDLGDGLLLCILLLLFLDSPEEERLPLLLAAGALFFND